MIAVPQSFRDEPRWWRGEGGRQWLDSLPHTVDERCRRWGLTWTGEVWHGSNALVVGVERRGTPFALRVSPPDDDLDGSVRALSFWAGRGTVELIDADTGSGSLLLERLDGSHTLAHEPLVTALPILAELVVSLAEPAPADVPSTSDVANEHAMTFEAEWERLGRPTSAPVLRSAVSAAAELARADSGGRAVDGDLHDGQVLSARRAPWLVVDPVLMRGDREYDLARILWTRFDEHGSPSDLVAAVDAFAAAADVPGERARDWVVVRSMSYLLWGLDHGLTIDPPRCRHLLDVFG